MNTETKKPRGIPERGYAVTKTRGGKDKIRLYLRGRVVLEQPVKSMTAAMEIGKAWAKS